ncbi:MAG: hypothetical protein V4463_03280 [Pseudomonadota bacterium]
MMGLFKTREAAPAPGGATVALRAGSVVPEHCVGVAFNGQGALRRVAEGGRIVLAAGEQAVCFHPGPYRVDVVPFVLSPEIGLRLSFAIDEPDPRQAQQRFDLFLASEAAPTLMLAELGTRIAAELQRELAQGSLALPPCTSLAEWNAFRAGLNRLLYTRFGVTVDDCIPVELDGVDYAQMLAARQRQADVPVPPVDAFDAALDDARAMRRLFLELPGVTAGLRQLALPAAAFQQHQALLRRCESLVLAAATMPALELAGPGLALAMAQQRRRARASVQACAALDEAWAMLSRADVGGATFDDADRILANLELHLAKRRETT